MSERRFENDIGRPRIRKYTEEDVGRLVKFRQVGNEYKPIICDPQYEELEVEWAPLRGSQEVFLGSPETEVLYEGTRGPGKDLNPNTLVLTDSGWKPAGQVDFSDKLVAPDGTYTNIIGIFPKKNRPMNLVVFDDGAEVEADDEHSWSVWDGRNGSRDGWLVRDTKFLAERLKQRCGWHIPLLDAPAPGLQWAGYDAYAIGVIIGDGTMSGAAPTVYTPEPEIVAHLEKLGWSTYEYPQYRRGGVMQMRMPSESYGNNGHRILAGSVPHEIGDQKYVPPKLLMADPASRLAVLQGLMDTDGHCDKDGRCEFKSVSEQLAKDVQYLARSLGGKARVHRQVVDPKKNQGYGTRDHIFRVKITHAGKFVPFRLPRHIARLNMEQHGTKRKIESITPCGVADGVCFEVAHPSHLFVVQDFIVTHNTLTLLMDFCQHVGQGYGGDWKGVLFRQTYPQLADVIGMSKKWFKRMWPDAFFNEIKTFWQWPSGEVLYFRPFAVQGDYDNFHGHNYPWIGWEELTAWPDANCFKVMFTCSRSTIKGMPRKIRATTNPYGVGHNWVQARYQLYNWPIPIGKNGRFEVLGPLITGAVDDKNIPEPPRRAVHGYLKENVILMHTEPEYINKIKAGARNESELNAWLYGSWDIAAGGMFDDIWYSHKDTIVVPDFEIPPTWRIMRAYDHGSSKPFSVGWYAESDGTDLEYRLPDGKWQVRSTVRGDLFRVGELYGWQNQQPNVGSRMLVADIKKAIVKYEVGRGWRDLQAGKSRVRRGPADTGIFDDQQDGRPSIASDFEAPFVVDGFRVRGIVWERADKGPGSREQGWEQMRKRLKATKRPDGGYREIPGLFVCRNCQQWLRTVPTLPRDEKKIDDVDSESEDHIGDENRYMLRFERGTVRTGRR